MRKQITMIWSAILAIGLVGTAFAQEPPQDEKAPPKAFPVERIFEAIDTDNDGVLSKEEFQAHIEKRPMRFEGRGPWDDAPRGEFRRGDAYRGPEAMRGPGPRDGGRGPMRFEGRGPWDDAPRGEFRRGNAHRGPEAMRGPGPRDGGRGPMRFEGRGPWDDAPRGEFRRGDAYRGPETMRGPGPRDGGRGPMRFEGRGPGRPAPDRDVPPAPPVAEEAPE